MRDAQVSLAKYIWIALGTLVVSMVLLGGIEVATGVDLPGGNAIGIGVGIVAAMLAGRSFAGDHKRGATKAEAHRFGLWTAIGNLVLVLPFAAVMLAVEPAASRFLRDPVFLLIAGVISIVGGVLSYAIYRWTFSAQSVSRAKTLASG